MLTHSLLVNYRDYRLSLSIACFKLLWNDTLVSFCHSHFMFSYCFRLATGDKIKIRGSIQLHIQLSVLLLSGIYKLLLENLPDQKKEKKKQK